jgi:A/G-specific adenine glycosylase
MRSLHSKKKPKGTAPPVISRRKSPPRSELGLSVFPSRAGIRSFQRRVLAWYKANARDLPWRHTRDPYAILVSEILSHQTQIARVVPVYERVLERYPTVEALAHGKSKTVKRITDPLGYKIRGNWLHGAALQVAEAGAWPTTLDELRKLKGVGRYTAAAVMSFAHRRDVPVVDTNIARVLSRYFGLASPTSAALWRFAGDLVPGGHGHRFHQALMDIGALVCRSRSPRCEKCPLWRSCAFRRSQRYVLTGAASASTGAASSRKTRPVSVIRPGSRVLK